MEKRITFNLKRRDYIKWNLSRIINARVFFIYYALLFAVTLPAILSGAGDAPLAAYIAIQAIFILGLTAASFFIMGAVSAIRAAIVYRQEKSFGSPITISFTDSAIVETTSVSSFTLAYSDIRKITLFRSLLVIHISSARAFLIPKGKGYDIAALYAELKDARARRSLL